MLYVKGTALGSEQRGKKDKPYYVLHILDGFEKTEVNSKMDFPYSEGELVEVPVRIFKDKLYLADRKVS